MTYRSGVWTVEGVATRFEEAVHTERSLPPVRVQGYFNLWPPILRTRWEQLAADDRADIHFPPSPEAIERMMDVLRWAQWLEPEQRHLVWMRAGGCGWRMISKRFNCDRTTAWRRWKLALEYIATELNQSGHPEQRV